MKITWIPEENHVRAEKHLMEITTLPEENHVSIGCAPEENHNSGAVLLMPGTITEHSQGGASQFELSDPRSFQQKRSFIRS